VRVDDLEGGAAVKRRFMTTPEVAETIGVTTQTVRNYCRVGLFPGARKPLDGSPWLIPVRAVEEFIDPPEQPLARSSRSRGRGRAA